MLSRLLQRVLPRVVAPRLTTSIGLYPALLARQHFVSRTLMTTAYLAEPPKATPSKSTAPKSTTSKSTNKKPTAGRKKPTKKAAAKVKAKKVKAKKVKAKKVKAKKVKAKTVKARAKPKSKPGPKPKAKPKKIDDATARLKGPLTSIKIKDEEMPPHRPLHAYVLFVRDQYKLKGATGRAAFLARAKEIGNEWKQLNEDERKPYYDQATTLSQEYAIARQNWLANADPRILRAMKAQRKAKGKPGLRLPTGNKPRASPFFLFTRSIANSPEISSVTHVLERARKAGSLWRALSAEEKQGYTAEAIRINKENRESNS